MILVNDHVLLPFVPQWARRPQWQRAWQTETDSSVLGNEARNALRLVPRRSLSVEFINLALPELGELNEAILAAKKSGLACAPFHGRGYVLGEDASTDEVTLDRNVSPNFASFLFFQNAAGYEVREIEGGADNVFTLDQAVARTYRAGTFCWPLIFGKFISDTQATRTPRTGPVRVSIQELVSPAAFQLGDVAPSTDEGIGAMVINDDFEVGLT